MSKSIRRYDIDWLRVIVFGLLIIYHVGMFFVPWGWHIKNDATYDWMMWPMRFVNQWRLSILFVISGMGTCFALSRRSGSEYRRERWKRLGLPLIVGMILIVPPQVYIERITDGDFTGSYFNWYFWNAFDGIYPSGNFSWNHLWFLPYLLFYSLILSPLFIYLRNYPDNKLIRWLRHRITTPFGLCIFIIPLYCAEAFMEPFFNVNHAFIGDWFALTSYLFLFLYGYLMIRMGNVLWDIIAKTKFQALITGIISFGILVLIWHQEDSVFIHFTEAFVKVFNLWTWIIVLFGYAHHWLNKPSDILSYCNTAVYPFYILHQTITIILGYYILKTDFGLLLRFSILTIGTFLFSWLLYEYVIRRIGLLRPFFGLK